MEFKGIVKTRSKGLIVVFIVLILVMLARTIMTQKWGYLPMVILVLLACFFSREQIVSEDGVNIRYFMFGKAVKDNLWTWDEISTIQFDRKKSRPNVIVLFVKDVTIRHFVMKGEELKSILRLAKKMNRKIYIEEKE